MRSSKFFLFAPVFVAQHVLVEASPLTSDDLLGLNKIVDQAKYDVSKKSSANVSSSVPLEAFGSFRTLPLEDILKDPTLLNFTAVPYHVSGSSTSGSKISAPELETLAVAATCASPQTRIEWRSYSASNRKAFINAIACLANTPSAGRAYSPSTSRYEDFARTHQIMTPTVHGNGIFILWHRYFLYTFEQALRTQCGFTAPLPWWDETKDSGEL